MTTHTAGHTPGPWRTGVPGRGRFCVYAPESHGRGIYVMSNTQQVRPEEIAKYGDHELNLVGDANARLIAAAPELLAFAEYVADENNALDFHTVIRMAKAAIAKAVQP